MEERLRDVLKDRLLKVKPERRQKDEDNKLTKLIEEQKKQNT